MVQCIQDPALSLQQPGSLLWHGFDPWPGNFHMTQAQHPPPKKIEINNKYWFGEYLTIRTKISLNSNMDDEEGGAQN